MFSWILAREHNPERDRNFIQLLKKQEVNI